MAGNLTLWHGRMASEKPQGDPGKTMHHLKFSGKNMHINKWSFITRLLHSTMGIQFWHYTVNQISDINIPRTFTP
jgi:hypothetical protein